ncbi:MAG: helix-turn-helix domain-containing protein [Planctomycetota bacterium]
MEREALTVQQAAELMQVSTDTVYRLVSSGELPAKKVGRIWRLHCSAIKTFLTSSSKPLPEKREEMVRT